MSPASGTWTADLRIDNPGASNFPAGTQVTITSENGYSRKGVIDPTRTGSRIDAVHVRVLGGAGGMQKPASARNFVQPGAFVSNVVNGFITDSGETLDSTTSSSFLSTNLTAWSTLGGNSVARNLKTLLNLVAPSLIWRILANGNLWIGQESWPTTSTTFDVMDFDPTDGSYLIASESPFIEPGQNLGNVGNVSRVLDLVENGRLRTRVWTDIPGTSRGIVDSTQRMALQALPGVDYYALYLCQVVKQSGTVVDLQPSGARNRSLLGGLQRVAMRGTTGVVPTLITGSTVLLGWDGGDPQSPYVLGGALSDNAQSVAVSALEDASIGGATVAVKADGATWIKANGSTLMLGTNPAATPVLTVGAIDSMGVPVSPAPTSTGTVLAG